MVTTEAQPPRIASWAELARPDPFDVPASLVRLKFLRLGVIQTMFSRPRAPRRLPLWHNRRSRKGVRRPQGYVANRCLLPAVQLLRKACDDRTRLRLSLLFC